MTTQFTKQDKVEVRNRLGMGSDAELCRFIDKTLKGRVYITGSAIRDPLVGLVPDDWDYVVVKTSHQEMIHLGFSCAGKDYMVYRHPITNDEYAVARLERSTGPGHQDFKVTTVGVTIYDDLRRRDLTINSIARPVGSANLIDPHNGLDDIKMKCLRHVGPAYMEDPLRVLRTCRFTSKLPEFHVANETLMLMQQMVRDGMIDHLTTERVWIEFEKALKCRAPWRFFRHLEMCGALKIVFPELHALIGVEQPREHHPEGDAFQHSMLVLKSVCRITKDPVIRFAAVCHDLGKGLTPREDWPKHIGHDKATAAMIPDMAEKMGIPNKYRDMAILGASTHHKIHQMGGASKVKKLLDILKAKHGDNLVNIAIMIALADQRGRGPDAENTYHEHARNLKRAARAYRNVKVRDGMSGDALVQALTQDRVLAIKSALA